jgi:hypothetical protein
MPTPEQQPVGTRPTEFLALIGTDKDPFPLGDFFAPEERACFEAMVEAAKGEETISETVALLSEGAGVAWVLKREILYSREPLASLPGRLAPSDFEPEEGGLVDLVSLRGASRRRKQEQREALSQREAQLAKSEVLRQELAEVNDENWVSMVKLYEHLVVGTREDIRSGLIEDTDSVKRALRLTVQTLNSLWAAVYLPDEIFSSNQFRALYPSERFGETPFAKGEVIAFVFLPGVEGFAYGERGPYKRLAGDLLQFGPEGEKMEVDDDPETARTRISEMVSSFARVASQQMGGRRIASSRTLDEFVERADPKRWQVQFLKAMAGWEVCLDAKAYCYGDWNMKQVLEGLFKRASRPTQAKKFLTKKEEEAPESETFSFRTEAKYALLVALTGDQPIELPGEQRPLKLQGRARESAEEVRLEMETNPARIKPVALSQRGLSQLENRLGRLAEMPDRQLRKLLERKEKNHAAPHLQVVLRRILSCPREERGKIPAAFLAVLPARDTLPTTAKEAAEAS